MDISLGVFNSYLDTIEFPALDAHKLLKHKLGLPLQSMVITQGCVLKPIDFNTEMENAIFKTMISKRNRHHTPFL